MQRRNGGTAESRRVAVDDDIEAATPRTTATTSSKGPDVVGGGALCCSRPSRNLGFQRLNFLVRTHLSEMGQPPQHEFQVDGEVISAATSSRVMELPEPSLVEQPAYSSVGGVSSSYSSPTMGSADSNPEAFEGGRRFMDKAHRPTSQVLQLRETIPLPEGGQAAAKEAFQGGVEERRNGSFGTGAVAP
ncbi:hypothetical protein V5799_033602 [Amblyomma americanum]|uniref:Uncharacterized protein n=1 Tax=Amblyomma americanum TaxID=6943 RepID=A0AAQ4DMV0_AMBAM